RRARVPDEGRSDAAGCRARDVPRARAVAGRSRPCRSGPTVALGSGAADGFGQPMSTSIARRVLLLGGSSEIGLAIVRRLLDQGSVQPFLLARDPDGLRDTVSDLERAGCTGIEVEQLDADDLGSHGET